MITDWLDPVSYKLGLAAGRGGGGGNPNYVETITGTLANPFGSYTPAEIRQMLASQSASVTLTIPNLEDEETGESYTNVVALLRAYGTNNMSADAIPTMDATDFAALKLRWNVSTSSYNAKLGMLFTGEYNYTDVDLTTPCTLTVIHHPLP